MSKDQDRLREQLSAWVDGELPPEQAGQLDRAIQSDSDLAAEVKALRGVRGLLGGLPRQPAPAGLREKVLARAERVHLLAGETGPAGRGPGWWVSRLAAAAVILLAVGVGAAVIAWVTAPSYLDRNRARNQAADRDALAVRRPEKPETTGLAPTPVAPAAPQAQPEAPTDLYFINTDNVALVQRELEQVFESNRIVVTDQPVGRGAGTSRPGPPAGQAGEAASTVQYVVTLDQDNLKRIVQEVNAIRARQNVPQIPLREESAGNELLAGGTVRGAGDYSKDSMTPRPFRPAATFPDGTAFAPAPASAPGAMADRGPGKAPGGPPIPATRPAQIAARQVGLPEAGTQLAARSAEAEKEGPATQPAPAAGVEGRDVRNFVANQRCLNTAMVPEEIRQVIIVVNGVTR